MDKAYFVLTFLAEIQQLGYLLFQQRGISICCCMLKDAGYDILHLKQSGRRQNVDLCVCDSHELREGASRLCVQCCWFASEQQCSRPGLPSPPAGPLGAAARPY
jgi:hypothetical protein